jgi:hypothetical protein
MIEFSVSKPLSVISLSSARKPVLVNENISINTILNNKENL